MQEINLAEASKNLMVEQIPILSTDSAFDSYLIQRLW